MRQARFRLCRPSFTPTAYTRPLPVSTFPIIRPQHSANIARMSLALRVFSSSLFASDRIKKRRSKGTVIQSRSHDSGRKQQKSEITVGFYTAFSLLLTYSSLQRTNAHFLGHDELFPAKSPFSVIHFSKMPKDNVRPNQHPKTASLLTACRKNNAWSSKWLAANRKYQSAKWFIRKPIGQPLAMRCSASN